MKTIITTKNLEHQSLEGFVEKKFNSLERFLKRLEADGNFKKTLAEVFLEIEKETKHHRKGDIFHTKAQVQLPGKKVMVQAVADDLFSSITRAKDLLKKEIEEYKFKKIDKIRRRTKPAKEEAGF